MQAAALGLYAAAAVGLVYVLGFTRAWYGLFAVSDIPLYHAYARAVASGARAYVDFPLEYPPLALGLIVLPWGGDAVQAYAWRFAGLMLVVGGAAAGVTAGAASRIWPEGRRPHAAAATFAAAVLGIGAIVANRLDAAVALIVAGFLLFAAQRRAWAAAAVLGLGFAVKLVPAILLPLAMVLAARPRAIALAAVSFALAAAAPFAPFLGDGTPGLRNLFAYHAVRPLQLESVLSTPLLVGHLLGLIPVGVGTAFGSQFLSAPGAETLARASVPLGGAALAFTYVLVWRRRSALRASPALVPLAAAAVILAFLSFGKVLSPQFLVWLLPLAALLLPAQRAIGALLLASLLLTHLEFPSRYWGLVRLEPGPVAIVACRNLALLAAFATSLVRLWRLPPEPLAPASDGGGEGA